MWGRTILNEKAEVHDILLTAQGITALRDQVGPGLYQAELLFVKAAIATFRACYDEIMTFWNFSSDWRATLYRRIRDMKLPVTKREVYASRADTCYGKCIGVTHSAKNACYLTGCGPDNEAFVKEIAL